MNKVTLMTAEQANHMIDQINANHTYFKQLAEAQQEQIAQVVGMVKSIASAVSTIQQALLEEDDPQDAISLAIYAGAMMQRAALMAEGNAD